MFDKKQKPVLDRSNVLTGLKTEPHEDAITRCGNMLVQSGYVNERYIEGMILRDRSFSTAIGNAIAIPHAVREFKSEIIATGLVVCAYPDGIEWDGQTIKLVIGIAANGDEHLDIMEQIVEAFDEESKVEDAVARGDAELLYSLLTGGDNT
jgi:mannitol/fructose-specific phosphotransferase system IIA component